MSDIVIRAENLGKKYLIGHQAGNGRYTTLRDVLAQNARGLWRKTNDLVRGKPIIQGDTMEEIWALKDVSFEIGRGEVVGIIGRNGAGKSTLLKVLSRITEPTTGRVTIKGRVASLLEVGTGFHPELTGRENVFLNGAILGMTRAEVKRKFDEIVAFAEVEKFLDTPVKRYSSGMYVRLAFAVAAHLEPEILIVDEVLAVGDASYQEKCITQMRKLASTGRTVLFVSHNMGFVLTLCRKALLLDGGTILATGPVRPIITSYFARSQTLGRSENPVRQNGIELVALRVNGKPADEVGDLAFATPFELWLRLRSDRQHKGARVQLSFFNGMEVKVAMISSREIGPGSFTLEGEFEVCVAVVQNALVPDKYRIDFQVKGLPEQPILYHLPSLWQFSVSERVLPGAWGPYTRENGLLYLESTIEIKPARISP